MKQISQPILRPGPTGQPYNMKDDREFKAWEDEWADFLGQSRSTEQLVTVKHGKKSVIESVADPARKIREGEALAFIRDYTGTFGLILDIRSDRRFGTKYMKLSDRQIEVVLASKARDEMRAEQASIARELFADDQYQQRTRSEATMVAKGPAAEGVYQLGERIFKVKRAKAGNNPSNHLYAIEFNPETTKWDYAKGMQYRLTAEDRMSVEQATAFGKLYGQCVNCGRTLTDEVSIERAIGPVCFARITSGL